MIQIMTGFPDGVPGFDATGKVTGENYETVLVPAAEGMLTSAFILRLVLK
jgi:hypothetical protein